MAAVQAFLATTELLEHMLVQLDFKTLLLVQRINHHFEAIIRNSDKLQKKIFFSPTNSFLEAQSTGITEDNALLVLNAQNEPVAILNNALVRNVCESWINGKHGHHFHPFVYRAIQAAGNGVADSSSWRNMHLFSWNPDPRSFLFSREGFWVNGANVPVLVTDRMDRVIAECLALAFSPLKCHWWIILLPEGYRAVLSRIWLDESEDGGDKVEGY